MMRSYSWLSVCKKVTGLLFFGVEVIKTKYNTAKSIRRFVQKYGKEYKEIKNYMKIEGWLTENEAVTLFNLARNLKNKENPVIVEIGSWLGKSSFIIATGIKQISRKACLFCIDPFNSEGDSKSKQSYLLLQERLFLLKHLTLKERFIRNMKSNNVYDRIKILEGYSFNFAKKFHKQIDILFIDSNHEYKAVLRDYIDWGHKIKKGGVIAFHDVEFDPNGDPSGRETHVGPGLVVKRKIIHNPLWENHHLVGGLFYAVKNER